MAKVRYLPHAPIIEAVIDFQVRLASDFSIDRFDALSGVLAGQYSSPERIQSMEARLGFEDGRPIPPDAKYTALGVRLKSPDNRAVAQFRSNGFTFNRLEPYTNWADVFSEALRLWREYVRVVGQATVTRLAVRYINRLRLPLPVPDLARYLVAPPVVAQGLPQTIRSFLTRIVVDDGDRGQSAIVTQTLEPSAVVQHHLMVLLDIDAYREATFAPDDPRLETVFGNLHDFKNEIFFESITEETVELFQ